MKANELQPIPLTPEIFEKNGFKQIGKKFIWGEIDDDFIEITPSINNSYQEWSEEDEKMIEDCIGAVAAADYYPYEDKQKMEKWLESLKDRMQPKPAEWSEDDEKNLMVFACILCAAIRLKDILNGLIFLNPSKKDTLGSRVRNR